MVTNNQKKIVSTPLAIALCLLAIGSIFRIQHSPFGFELKLTSLIAIGVLYVIRYGVKKSKNIKDSAKAVMVLSWVLFSVFAMYKMNNLVYIRIILEVSGSTWFALIGMLFMIAYALFKIKHWPYAGPMYVLTLIALILLAIGFILDSRELKKDYL